MEAFEAIEIRKVWLYLRDCEGPLKRFNGGNAVTRCVVRMVWSRTRESQGSRQSAASCNPGRRRRGLDQGRRRGGPASGDIVDLNSMV